MKEINEQNARRMAEDFKKKGSRDFMKWKGIEVSDLAKGGGMQKKGKGA